MAEDSWWDESGESDYQMEDTGSGALESDGEYGIGTTLYGEDETNVVYTGDTWEIDQDPRYGTSGESSYDLDWGDDAEEGGLNWGGLWGGVKDVASGLWNSDLLWDGLSLLPGLFMGGDDDKGNIKIKRPRGGGGGGGGAVKHGGHGDAQIKAESLKRTPLDI